MSNLKVHVTYRNADMRPVSDFMYSLEEYTGMLRNDLVRMITDIEDLVYCAADNKPRDEWDDETWSRFSRLRHKLLDKAGDVARLPECIVQGGEKNGADQKDPKG